ncbi:MAG: DUF1232 domain-containing protein [Burkholderiales bacterium]
MGLLRLRRMFRAAGRDALIVFFAIRDPRTPRRLKLAAVAALAWIFSPVDPLPDLPLIGWVDDLLVFSVALPLIMRKLPAPVLMSAVSRADQVIALWGLVPGAGAPGGRESARGAAQARRGEARGAARPAGHARGRGAGASGAGAGAAAVGGVGSGVGASRGRRAQRRSGPA